MKVRLIRCTDETNSQIATARCKSSEPFDKMLMTKKGMRHALESGHESIMEFTDYTFAIDGISRSCLAQLTRHRMASYCVMSQRYMDMSDFDYVVPKTIEDNPEAYEDFINLMETIQGFYKDFVDVNDGYGIPEEDARYILPNACTTNVIMKINARSLKNFLSLRMCNNAQWEIRELADEMYRLVCKATPIMADYFGPPCWFDGCKEFKPCLTGKPNAVTKKISEE